MLAGLPDPGEAERRWLDESLAIGRRTGDPVAAGEALLFLGRVLSASGEATAAEACYREGATLLEAVGDRATGALGLTWLGGHLLRRGDAAAARPVLERGLRSGASSARSIRSPAPWRCSARRPAGSGTSRARPASSPPASAWRARRGTGRRSRRLEGLAWVAGERGRADRAEQLAAAAAALRAVAAPSIHEPPGQPGPPTRPPSGGRPPTLARALEEAIAEATAPQSGARGG